MASSVHKGVLSLLLLLGLVLLPFQHRESFACPRPRQESGRTLRERSGLGLRTSASDVQVVKITRDEQRLVSIISEAAQREAWNDARIAFASYDGDAAPVYSTALHAAVRCREYQAGAKIFEKCQKRCKIIHGPVYTQALKIYGKLEEPTRVREIWAEAMEVCELNIVLASARMAAAADEGDIEGAATLLDQVNASGIPFDTSLVNSAIRTCWGSTKYRDKAARYFYGLFAQFELVPTVVTFATLAGAFKCSPLKEILWTYQEMKALQIAPNRVFAETFLTSVLGGDKMTSWRTSEEIVANLRHKPRERLKAAGDALKEFESSKIELSLLSQKLKTALQKLGF